ncbi:GGDEF domain-containing protein [Kibdelosporangium philippinense]|uniref:GGDEF domain-containing protein n=1 Tax=Kibdelosporangium philippinense TaxID=211113 RepID=A0ABS8ZHH2_9PSEU|nr:GGDEF domain-containing protein [Kibdelosporangium philippinense]MCE7006355.1 GGDEF domain-containing protein [Kibdelosporangium philippinense]
MMRLVAVLLPPTGVAVLAGIFVPMTAMDWVRAAVILVAAIVTMELVRRIHTVRHNDSEPIIATSVWAVAAAVSVHLTPAVALVLVLCAYHSVRGKHDVWWYTIAWALIPAHFAVSFGAWETPSPQANFGGVLTVVLAAGAYLVASHAVAFLRYRRLGRLTEIGLDAAFLVIGAITGVLMTGTLIVVLAAIPVVISLYSAAMTKQLEGDAFVDKKTGMANAAAWQKYADRVVADAEQERREVGVLMVDLDKFKRLNDTYGHRAGDDVLTAVGDCLKSNLRKADLGGRFGGEEFTVLLPDTNVLETMATAERIRLAIQALRITTVDKDGDDVEISDVTASIGAATYPHHGTGIEECLRVADNYVYQAKEQGRNRVVGISTENITSIRP